MKSSERVALSPKSQAGVRSTVLGALGALLLWLLHRTVRWKYVTAQGEQNPWCQTSSPVVMAFWHRYQLMLPFLYRQRRKRGGKGMFALISRHGDGRIIAEAVRWIGIGSVAGSSTRGGSQAAKQLVERVQAGFDACVTPDGPKGPIYKSKEGVLRISQQANARLLPCTYAVESKWEVNSWDRMVIPKPFTRGIYYVGEEIPVPESRDSSDLDQSLSSLDAKLMEIDLTANELLKDWQHV